MFDQEAIQNFVVFSEVLKRIHVRIEDTKNAHIDEQKSSMDDFPKVCDKVLVNKKLSNK